MSDDLELILEETRDSMKKALNHLESELVKIRAGKASPQMLEGLTVDYYGSPTLLNQVGNVSVMDARTLTIQPWEKNMLQPIERAIINANLGVTPQNDGNIIRLFMPPLTEEKNLSSGQAAKANNPGSPFAVFAGRPSNRSRNCRRTVSARMKPKMLKKKSRISPIRISAT